LHKKTDYSWKDSAKAEVFRFSGSFFKSSALAPKGVDFDLLLFHPALAQKKEKVSIRKPFKNKPALDKKT
jgi:hypothetical protein